jgi:hypothetical protein
MRFSVPSYVILSHKLIELSARKVLSRRDTASSSVVSRKIRRYSGTTVMTIKESLNIAKIQVPFRGKYIMSHASTLINWRGYDMRDPQSDVSGEASLRPMLRWVSTRREHKHRTRHPSAPTPKQTPPTKWDCCHRRLRPGH